MATVNFRGSPDDVRRVLQTLVAIMSGRQADTLGLAQGVMISIGFAALSDIKSAFITKARGGTDEMGVKWPPLSRDYLAYGRRFGKTEASRLKKKAGLGRANRHKGLLTKSQLKQWRFLYVQFLRRFELSMGPRAARARAASTAWNIMKKRGAKTKLEVFGDRQVEMLRDRGVMFNSLSPGVVSGSGTSATYAKPAGEGGDLQMFEILPGALVITSNVEYFAKHQTGDGVPQRKMIPDETTPVPAVWWSRWAAAGNKALIVAAVILLEMEGRR